MKRLTTFFLCLLVFGLFLTFPEIPIANAESNFGYTGSGASFTALNDQKYACRFQAPASGSVTRISAYIGGSGWGVADPYAVIYSDNSGAPNALLGTSSATAFSGAAWYNYTFSPSVSITSGAYYWLGVIRGGGEDLYPYYTTGSTNQGAYNSDTPPPSDPFGTPTYDNNKYRIYAVYTPSGTAYTAALTLGWTQAISAGTQWVASTALTLGITQSLNGAVQWVASVSETLGITGALNGAIVSVFNVAETLGITSALNGVVVSVFNVAASLVASLGLNAVVSSVFNVTTSLGIGLGLVAEAILSGATAYFADLTLGFGLGSDVAVQWVASVPATLSIISTLNGAVASTFNIALTNGFSLASDVVANLYTPIAHIANLTLGIVLAIAVGAVLLAGVSMEGLNFILAIVGISLAVVALISFSKDR